MSHAGRVHVAEFTWTPLGMRTPTLEIEELAVHPGERVLLAGASGAGKSTLLRAIAGVLENHTPGEATGRVEVAGAAARAGRPDVGYVAQQPFDAVVAEFVGHDVAFGPENLGVPAPEIPAVVAEALDLVRFPYGPHHPTGALSGDEAQRLALAGVLALRPGVLLLDEPCSMLDAHAAAQLRLAVARVVERIGATLIVADHDLAAWKPITSRLVVLDAGRVVADGAADPLLTQRREELLECGLWVPGGPPPEPLAVDLPPFTATETVPAKATGLVVDRRAPLTLGLRSPAPRRVLNGVDVRVAHGEFVALRGDSGTGKSTLLGAILGSIPPTSGSVELGGVPEPDRWSSRDLAKRVGWVPQAAETVVVGDTVLACLLATVHKTGQLGAASEPAARRLLDALGLSAFADRHPLSLSGGELRRLAVASAVLHGPQLVLADEPTVGLDRHAWAAVAGVLVAARMSGAGLLVVTHDPGVVGLADRQVALSPVSSKPMPDRPAPSGPLGSVGPLALLGAVIVLTVAGLLAPGPLPLGIGLGVLVAVGAVLVGFRFPRRRLIAPVAAMVSVAWSNWLLASPRSIDPAVLAALRVGFIVLPGVVAAAYLNPTALGGQLGGLLRMPTRPVLAMVVALRRFDSLAVLWQELALARRVCGLGPSRSPVSRVMEWAALSFGLLVAAIRQAGRLAVAMDSRGYSAPGPRTWSDTPPWRWRDTALIALAMALGALPFLLAAIIGG